MKKEITKKNNNRKCIAVFLLSCILAGFALTFKTVDAIPFWAYGEVSQDFVIARIYSLLGDYQFDMVIASVLCGCAFYLIKEKIPVYLKGYVLPMVLGFVVIMGRSVTEIGNLSGIFETFPYIIRSCLAGIGYGIIFRYVFALFEYFLDVASSSSKSCRLTDRIFDEHTFRNVFIILIILWLPVYIINLPGNYNSDFIGQLMQNTGDMPWSSHHPIVLTFLIGIFFGFFKMITGNYDLALSLWILFQASALAAALAYTLSFLKKKNASKMIMGVILGIYVLSPIYSNIATTAIKDVPFAAACIWYLICCLRFYEDEEAFLKSKRNVADICIAAFFVCMCRNNGVILIFVNGIVMCVHALGKAGQKRSSVIRKALLFLIIPIGVFTALSSGIKAAKNAESDGLKEMLSIPMQQTALYITRYEDEMTAEETGSIDALFGDYRKLPEHYDPFISDPVKQYYDTDASSPVVSAYLKTWFKCFFKHPGTYFESFFISTYGWFDPEVDTSVRYEEDPDLFTKAGLFEGADEILIFFYRYVDRFSLLGMLQSPGLWVWIMFILIRRQKGDLHLYPMMIVTLLVCMAGPCFMKHARYAFPIMFTIPMMMGYEGLKRPGEKE